MKEPDMLINHDTKILMQLVQAAMGKGEGVSIVLNSVNQLNIYLEGAKTAKVNSPETKMLTAAPGLKPNRQQKNYGFKKDQLITSLNDNGWSIEKASGALGVHSTTLRRYIKMFSIVPPSGTWLDRRRKEIK